MRLQQCNISTIYRHILLFHRTSFPHLSGIYNTSIISVRLRIFTFIQQTYNNIYRILHTRCNRNKKSKHLFFVFIIYLYISYIYLLYTFLYTT